MKVMSRAAIKMVFVRLRPFLKCFVHDGRLNIIRLLAAMASPHDHFNPLKAVNRFGNGLLIGTTRDMIRGISKEPSLSPLHRQNGRWEQNTAYTL